MKADVEPFRAIVISRLAHELERQGRSVIHMEFGQPSTGAPERALVSAQKILASDPMGYWESPDLKNRIVRRYADVHGVNLSADQITLTCGASPALVLALTAVFSPGDRVALARPGYVAYRNTLRALSMTPVEIPCGAESRFQLTSEQIEALDPPPAGIIVASPANPTGTIISPSGLQAIAQTAQARSVRIISDEIYHGLTYGPRTASILEFDPDAFVVNSFSKYFSMVGWRLGWLVSPLSHVDRVRALVGNMFLTAPSLSQHAGLAAMDSLPELEGHVAVYRRNRDLLMKALPEMGLSRTAPPDGAFYIYADIGHLTSDSMAFCERLLRDTGVATAPGVDFDPIEGGRHIRFSFAVSTDRILEAIDRMTPWFRERGREALAPGEAS
jgi:aspartate/methionine/tyrosine aminotransferase